jgi:hypothetical protein
MSVPTRYATTFKRVDSSDEADSPMSSENRHFAHSDHAAVSDDVDSALSADQREALKVLYGEVCTTWRTLLDVRFKLLGLVPFVTVAVLVALLPSSREGLTGRAAWLVCTVGLLVTVGLLIYEKRNSELYNELISRGRRIEAELGIKIGIFRGRPESKIPYINHTTAIALIYVAALFGWLVALIMTL